MEDRRQRREEEKQLRRHDEERPRTPFYLNSRFWMWTGVIVLCALMIYWVLFIAIWDGPNQ